MYVHGVLYKANSVKTHQHWNILTKQIMQDYCRGKQKGSNIRNLNMKASNSDKLGNFKMVKTVQYTGGMSLSFSTPSPPMTPRQWYPGKSGLKLLFKVQWLCDALLSSDQSSSSASYLQLQINKRYFYMAGKEKAKFPFTALGTSHHCWVLLHPMEDHRGGVQCLSVSLCVRVTTSLLCARGCKSFDPTPQNFCQHCNPHVVSG